MKFWVRSISIISIGFLLFTVGCMGPGTSKSSAAMGDLTQSQLFILKDLNGNNVSLADLLKTNKAVLINFWATWCPPCREEIPGLIALQSNHKDRSFTVLGVDVGESQAKVSSFAQKIGINYPVLLDGQSNAAESYGIVGIPTTILLNSEGKVLGVYHAYTRQLVEDIEKALQ